MGNDDAGFADVAWMRSVYNDLPPAFYSSTSKVQQVPHRQLERGKFTHGRDFYRLDCRIYAKVRSRLEPLGAA